LHCLDYGTERYGVSQAAPLLHKKVLILKRDTKHYRQILLSRQMKVGSREFGSALKFQLEGNLPLIFAGMLLQWRNKSDNM